MSDYTNSPLDGRPIMMMRLRYGNEVPGIWERLQKQLIRYKECADEVWFSTGVGIPPIGEHRRLAELIGKHAAELRKHGIIPSLQIQATIGHGDSITAAAGADGKTWGSYVGKNGEKCRYINCFRQEGFLEYIRQMCEFHAQWHPGSVWIDDDLRLDNHSPAMEFCGCYCPHCLSLFSREEGRKYTREELIDACGKEPELQKRWEEFGAKGISTVAEIIVRAFQKYSPETRFGLQHCIDPARKIVFDALAQASGKRIGSRPGGGAYTDHDPYGLIDKGFFLNYQIAEQPGYELLDQICPEIEDCPRTFRCKTTQGLRLESLLYLSLGMDSLSYFIIDPPLETPEWYGEELFKPLAAEAADFREYIRHNTGTVAGGIRICTKRPASQLGLPFVGLPQAAYSAKGCCIQLCKEDAETLSAEKLTEIFKGDVILDGEAAVELEKRKLSALTGGVTASYLNESVSDYPTDDPFNAGLAVIRHTPFSEKRYCFAIPENLSCRVVSRYKDRTGKDFGAATLLVEMPAGNRIALIGYDGYKTEYITSSRVNFLYRVCDWVSHHSLPVLPAQAVQCLQVPRLAVTGELKSVTVINPTISFQKPFELVLRGVPEGQEFAEWHIPSEMPVNVRLRREDGCVTAELPGMMPWGIGWLKL